MSKRDMIGKKFGNLLVINFGKSIDQRLHWLCKCDCGQEKLISGKLLRNGQTKTCGCRIRKYGKNHPNWKGFNDLSGRYLERVRRHAKNRNIVIEVTPEEMWRQFERQGKICALSGKPLILEHKKNEYWNASLDRIDSKKGYIIGNIQWVDKRINWMKGNLKDSEFYKICSEVVDFLKSKNK